MEDSLEHLYGKYWPSLMAQLSKPTNRPLLAPEQANKVSTWMQPKLPAAWPLAWVQRPENNYEDQYSSVRTSQAAFLEKV
jgi:hypothetical protein